MNIKEKAGYRLSGGYCEGEVQRKLEIALMFSARTTEIMTVISWSTTVGTIATVEGETVILASVMFYLKVLLRHLLGYWETKFELGKTFTVRGVEGFIIEVPKVIRVLRKGSCVTGEWETGEAVGESLKQSVLKTRGREVFQKMGDQPCQVQQRNIW